MARKRTTPKPKPAKPELIRKNLFLPADWIEAIDAARGAASFSEFVRAAIAARLKDRDLSEMPAWGQGRPRKN